METDAGANATEDNFTTIDCDEDDGRSSGFHVLAYIMYCTVFVVAVTGNGMVCFIVQRYPRMRTVTNFFIANLAVGDILMSLFCVPFTFMPTFVLGYWPFGSAMCVFVPYVQGLSVLLSAYTMVAISIDRYMAIMWPLKPRLSKKHAILVILIVWLFALVTPLPIAIFSELSQPDNYLRTCNKYVCVEQWGDLEREHQYTIVLFTLQFFIPLAVLLFTYASIALVVWCKRVPGEAENSRDQRIARGKWKMTKMMVTVVVVFVTCWLPMNIYLLQNTKGSMVLMFLFHWLAMSHACYNPIIYFSMSGRFRTGFVHIVMSSPCRFCVPFVARRQRSNSSGLALAGTETTDTSVLNRVNTCSTYISMRCKQPPHCLCNNHGSKTGSVQHRHHQSNDSRRQTRASFLSEDQI